MASFASTIFQFLGLATYNASPQTYANGSSNALQSDANGNLSVRVAAYGPVAGTTWADTGGLANSQVVKASSGALYTLEGSNESTTTKLWIMLFDATSVPANGTAPKVSIPVPAASATYAAIFSWNRNTPRAFATGIVWAASTTAGTLTLYTGAVAIQSSAEYT